MTLITPIPPLACEQALHLGEWREVTREQHAKAGASVRGFLSRSRVARFARRKWRACIRATQTASGIDGTTIDSIAPDVTKTRNWEQAQGKRGTGGE